MECALQGRNYDNLAEARNSLTELVDVFEELALVYTYDLILVDHASDLRQPVGCDCTHFVTTMGYNCSLVPISVVSSELNHEHFFSSELVLLAPSD